MKDNDHLVIGADAQPQPKAAKAAQPCNGHVAEGFKDVLEALKEMETRMDRMLWYMHFKPQPRKVKKSIFTRLMHPELVC
jgi:hypothetical protein